MSQPTMPFSAADLAPQPLASARSLPADFYVHPDIPALDRAAVFARSWQLAGHVSQLRNAGDHVIGEVAGLPYLVLCDEQGALRAFHNVCRHRAGPLLAGDGCGLKRLRCRYHGWTYGLDGVLRSAPEMGDAADFDPATIRLPTLAVHDWQGMVFVAVGEAPEFADWVAGIDARVAGLHLHNFTFHRRSSYVLDCHWKIYADNYLEGYHVPHVHPQLNRMLDYRQYRTELSAWHSLQCSPLDSDPGLYGSGEALYYFLYPNTMLNILPGRLQTNRILPLGPDRCRVDFDFHYAPGIDPAKVAGDEAFSDVVQAEDEGVCLAVQRGLASGSYVPGRLNPLRESAVHHFHERLRAAYRQHAATMG
jgi:choline monooxygenase